MKKALPFIAAERYKQTFSMRFILVFTFFSSLIASAQLSSDVDQAKTQTTSYSNIVQEDDNGQNKDTITSLRKNTICATLGGLPTLGGVGVSAWMTYDRMLYHFDKKYLNAIWARVGGGYGWWRPQLLLEVVAITGVRNNHFELASGIAPAFSGGVVWYHPGITAGYRYQKPGGWGVFRIGAGWPEGAYISFGIGF